MKMVKREQLNLGLYFAAAAKFSGSGGAVVALCAEGGEGGEMAEDLQAACREEGFTCVRVRVGPVAEPDPNRPGGLQGGGLLTRWGKWRPQINLKTSGSLCVAMVALGLILVLQRRA
jgi:hypothetical protein